MITIISFLISRPQLFLLRTTSEHDGSFWFFHSPSLFSVRSFANNMLFLILFSFRFSIFFFTFAVSYARIGLCAPRGERKPYNLIARLKTKIISSEKRTKLSEKCSFGDLGMHNASRSLSQHMLPSHGCGRLIMMNYLSEE